MTQGIDKKVIVPIRMMTLLMVENLKMLAKDPSSKKLKVWKRLDHTMVGMTLGPGEGLA